MPTRGSARGPARRPACRRPARPTRASRIDRWRCATTAPSTSSSAPPAWCSVAAPRWAGVPRRLLPASSFSCPGPGRPISICTSRVPWVTKSIHGRHGRRREAGWTVTATPRRVARAMTPRRRFPGRQNLHPMAPTKRGCVSRICMPRHHPWISVSVSSAIGDRLRHVTARSRNCWKCQLFGESTLRGHSGRAVALARRNANRLRHRCDRESSRPQPPSGVCVAMLER